MNKSSKLKSKLSEDTSVCGYIYADSWSNWVFVFCLHCSCRSWEVVRSKFLLTSLFFFHSSAWVLFMHAKFMAEILRGLGMQFFRSHLHLCTSVCTSLAYLQFSLRQLLSPHSTHLPNMSFESNLLLHGPVNYTLTLIKQGPCVNCIVFDLQYYWNTFTIPHMK